MDQRLGRLLRHTSGAVGDSATCSQRLMFDYARAIGKALLDFGSRRCARAASSGGEERVRRAHPTTTQAGIVQRASPGASWTTDAGAGARKMGAVDGARICGPCAPDACHLLIVCGKFVHKGDEQSAAKSSP